MSKPVQANQHGYIRYLLYIGIICLLVVLLVRQRATIVQAAQSATHANTGWLVLGIVAMFATLPASTLVYKVLSPKPLRFGRTLLVQMAGFCVNKLLPSGSGAAGTSFLYLRANKVSTVQAGAVVLLNNILGLLGHVLLFLFFILFEPSALGSLDIASNTVTTGIQILSVVGLLAAGLAILLRSKLANFVQPLKSLLTHPRDLLKALSASMLITLSYAVSLFASAAAVGVHLSLATAIIALSASVLATSIVPTPGGVGAAEAGAYTGLVAMGVNNDMALATALLYRVCTFWIPLIIGSGAFILVVKRGYLKARA
ncbi:flippase-like domain-containing protein [Aeromicrobium sp.]|nr:flippase-like domain-containing protein [Candidatus Saccharibacteria bacterium]